METSTAARLTVPPNAPPPDHLVAILSELTSASERMTDALGTLARNMERVDHAVEGIGRIFAEAHGTHEATLLENGKEMKKIHHQMGLLVGEVRAMLRRIGPLELEVSDLRDDKQQVMQRLSKLDSQ